jgi:hypothetical protein
MAANRKADLNKYWENIKNEMKQTPNYDFQTLQKGLYHECMIAGYSPSEIEKFSSKCFELALKIDEKENKPLLDNVARKIWLNLLNSLEVTELLEDPTKLTLKQKSLVSLYYYLTLVEGGSTTSIQFIAFMLIKNGQKFYDRYSKRFVKTYEDMEHIDLSSKLKLLTENGLDLAVKSIDRNLRNCIAHQDFIISDDGAVVNLKTGEQIDIQEKVRSLLLNGSLVTMVLTQTFDVISPSTDEYSYFKTTHR